MHLVLGHSDDSCCAGVLGRLKERGLPACLLPDPLAPPARFAWRLDDVGLESSLAIDGSNPETISSVLGLTQPDGTQQITPTCRPRPERRCLHG